MPWPFAAAVLLGLASMTATAREGAATRAVPAGPDAALQDDWSELNEIPVPVTVTEPGAPGATPAPVDTGALLVPAFEQALATARSAATAAQRVPAYRDALSLFDRIRLRQPEFGFRPGLDALVASYVDALNAERAALLGDAHERNLAEARAVVLRLGASAARTGKMLDIAQVERDSGGTPKQLLLALHSVVGEVLPQRGEERDRALGRAVELAAGGDPDVRAAGVLWSAEIDDHLLRDQALRRLADASIAADPLLAELAGSTRLGGDARARLLDLSNYMTNDGRFAAATWLAAAAPADARGERDEALALVVEDMIRADAEPSAILAVHGIGNAAVRDRTLLDLVGHALDQRQLHEARHFARLVAEAPAATLASSMIGLWLAGRDHLEQARDAARTALAASRKAMPAAGPARDAIIGKLAELHIRVGDRAQARGLLPQLGQAAAATVRVSLIREALAARQWTEADADLAKLPAGPPRDEAEVLYVSALASERRLPEAAERVGRIAQPLARMDALTATLKALAGSGQDPVLQRDLARQVDALSARVPVGSGQDLAQAYVAQSAAAIGEFDRARRSLDAAATSSGFSNALRYTAQRLAAAGQADTALRDLDRVWKPAEHARAITSVATTLAKQGELERAVGLVRAMKDDRLRTLAFVSVAQAAAQQADRNELFVNAAPMRRPVALPVTLGEEHDAPRPYSSSRARSLYTLANDDLGEELPGIPPLGRLTAKDVAAGIPVIAPGRVHVLPMQYSDFNEKFMASLSYVFNDYGGRLFHFDAQKTPFPVFISLESGVFDLPGIARHLERIGKPQYLVREGRRYTLRIPLLVGTNARLVVSGTDVDELRMNRGTGAYLVNAGYLHVQGTRVSGWDESLNDYAPLSYSASGSFRPFIVGWSGSVTDIAGSTLTHLGFSGGKAYGLTYSSGPQILLKSQATGLRRPTGRVVENSFQHMLYGFYSYEADDVAIVGNEYRDNIVYGVDPHDRSKRLLIAYNTAYGTQVKHGIIISREVDDGWIAGNLSFDNQGSGIMLDRNSKGNLVYANSAFDNRQDGITLFESPCNLVASNHLFANDRDGLKSRNSWDVGVFDNRMAGNRGMAVTSYIATLKSEHQGHERDFEEDPYTQLSDIALVRNTLTRNGAGGVGLQGVSSLTWKGNSLVEQVKPVKGVDKAMLPELYGRSNRGVVVRLACEVPKVAQSCGFKAQGLLPREVAYEPLAVCAVPAAPTTAASTGAATAVPLGAPRTRASAAQP